MDNGSNVGLEYATITFENLKEKVKVIGGITDEKGNFSLKVNKGTYNMRVQFFTYKAYEMSKFVVNGDKNVGVIKLTEEVEQLAAVEVVGTKSTVEMKLDKKAYNVGDDMAVKDGSISDVLDNVPSVTVSNDGAVSLRGSENVIILVNGKPSSVLGMTSETLKQLPSDMIQKVEVITNPSSRYEAEGSSGIINIVLKQGKGLGLTGSVGANVGVGDTEMAGANVNLNLRKNKFNFFNTTSVRWNNFPGEMTFEQESFDRNGNIKNYQNEYRDNNRKGTGFNTNFGVDYNFTDKISMTNTVFFGLRGGENDTDANIFNYDKDRVLV